MKEITNKVEFLRSITEKELHDGYIKFNIPNEEKIDSLNGEGVWGWVTPLDKEKYNNDNYYGKITAILCNDPINYYGRLIYGAEVVLQCHGKRRPTLDVEWVIEYLGVDYG